MSPAPETHDRMNISMGRSEGSLRRNKSKHHRKARRRHELLPVEKGEDDAGKKSLAAKGETGSQSGEG